LVVGWCCGGVERLYFDAERFADPAKSVRGGIPLLFPVCGNLPDNVLTLPQGRFAMAQHGFARDLPWELAALDGGAGIRLCLRDSEATRAMYPFGFRLSLDYTLEPGALAICARVEHTQSAGGRAMPFAFGLHPYLQVHSLEQAQLLDLPERCFDHLSAAEASTAEQLQRLPLGVDLRVDPVGQPAPVPRLLTGDAAIALHMQPPFSHVVVWSDPPRSMVCLEPWSARRGELGLQLESGEQAELRCRYAVMPG